MSEKNEMIVGMHPTKNTYIANYIIGFILLFIPLLTLMQDRDNHQLFFCGLTMFGGYYLLHFSWKHRHDYDFVRITADEISFELRYNDKVECFQYPLNELVAIEYFQLLQSTNSDDKSFYRDRTLLFKDTNKQFFQKWQTLNVNKRISFKFKNNEVVQLRGSGSNKYPAAILSQVKEITEFLQQNGIVVADHLIEKE